MSTTTTDGVSVAERVPPAQFAALAGGLLGAVGSAAYISSFFLLHGDTGREAVQSPLCVTANMLMTAGFIALALALPGLTARLPRWALLTSAVGCVFVAAIAWADATSGAHFAAQFTDAQWEKLSNGSDGRQIAEFLPKILLCGVGFGALAVTGWRRRAISRGACVLLALAALVSLVLMPIPPGALLGGLALAWAARSAQAPDN
jgi:hypothetical protein